MPAPKSDPEALCTAKEIEALRLYDDGLSPYRIALRLGLGRETIRNRLLTARRKIAIARRGPLPRP